MGRASVFLVDLTRFGRHLDAALRVFIQPLLLLVEHIVVEATAIDDIELAH